MCRNVWSINATFKNTMLFNALNDAHMRKYVKDNSLSMLLAMSYACWEQQLSSLRFVREQAIACPMIL